MRDWLLTRWLPTGSLWRMLGIGLCFSSASTPHALGGFGALRASGRSAAVENGGAVTANDLPSEAQLAAIYREFSGQIHTYAFHLLGNQEDADDITQEVFIRAYARMAQLREQASMRSWLYRIATNLCMDHLRRRSRVKRIFGVEVALGGSPGSDEPPRDIAQPMALAELEGVAERDHIALALKRMSDKYAICLLLHSLQGLTYREIADVVGITPGAAAVRLRRARDLFARYYEELRREDMR